MNDANSGPSVALRRFFRCATRIVSGGIGLLRRAYLYGGIAEVCGTVKTLVMDCLPWLAAMLSRRKRSARTQVLYPIADCPELDLHKRLRDGVPGTTVAAAMREAYGLPLDVIPCDDANERRAGVYGTMDFSQCPAPRTAVIIPVRDGTALLRQCVDAVRATPFGRDCQIIVVDNGSVEAESLAYFEHIRREGLAAVMRIDERFNWGRLNNLAAATTTAEVLVFLNNDILGISTDWLRDIAVLATARGVGAVGPMMLYADGSIQHAGIVVGMARWADHLYRGVLPQEAVSVSDFVSPCVSRQVTAVTGACMAIRRDTFVQFGGFDERMQVVFSDVELCVRLQREGYRNIYLASARIYHLESKTRDSRIDHVDDFRIARSALEPWRTQTCDPHFRADLSKFSLTPSHKRHGPAISHWIR